MGGLCGKPDRPPDTVAATSTGGAGGYSSPTTMNGTGNREQHSASANVNAGAATNADNHNAVQFNEEIEVSNSNNVNSNPVVEQTSSSPNNNHSNTNQHHHRHNRTASSNNANNVETSNRTSRQQEVPQEDSSDEESHTGASRATFRSAASNRPPVILPNSLDFHPSINGRNGWRFENIYEVGEELGRGAFGSVYIGRHKFASSRRDDDSDDDYDVNESLDELAPEWRDVAIKRTRPNSLDTRGGREIRTYDQLEKRCQEIKTLLRLREGSASISNVLYLYEYFMSGRDFYCVTELLGQELDEFRNECETFTERMAIDICRSVLQGVDFMHSRKVVHRDIKLQNVLFRRNNDFKSLKIVDFGLARTLEDDQAARDFCGSIGYISPEIYQGKPYRFEVDMFAFGVMLFRLLSGEKPFPANDEQILKRNTVELRYSVNGRDWENVSPAAKDLVRKLLINRQERLTAEQALEHRWFQERGASVLRTDLTHVQGQSRSEAFVRSHAPTASMSSRGDGSRFWIDANIQVPLSMILSLEIYSGRVVDQRMAEGGEGGLICIEEILSPIVRPAPEYVSNLNKYTEKECRDICLQLARCIEILHDSGIAHRNLHLENVLIDPFGKVSIKGLQYAQSIQEGQPLTGHFGYLYSWYAFKAPEVDSDFVHGKGVDLWSLGATIYMLLSGLPPFRGNGMELIQAKHAGLIDFDIIIPSASAQRLVRGLLQVRPENRYTVEDVLNDEWMLADDDYLENFPLDNAHAILQDFQET